MKAETHPIYLRAQRSLIYISIQQRPKITRVVFLQIVEQEGKVRVPESSQVTQTKTKCSQRCP